MKSLLKLCGPVVLFAALNCGLSAIGYDLVSMVFSGDIVPTEKVYTIFTMMYIIFGLSLATMCIDLAGTEYINKIHYLGKKMVSIIL